MKKQVLAVALLTASTAALTQQVAVRVDSQQASALPGELEAQALSFDYGSYRWFWLDAKQLSLLNKAGVRYSVVDASTVRLGKSSIDPTLSNVEPLLDDSGRGLFVVQFQAPQRSEWVNSLSAQGLRVLSYIPHNSVLVYGQVEQVTAVRNAPFVRGSMALSQSQKRDLSLDFTGTRPGHLKVFYFNAGDDAAVPQAISALGAIVLKRERAQPDRAFFTADVLATNGQLNAMLALPHVVNIGFEGQAQLDDEQANQIMSNNFINPTTLALGYRPFLQNELGGLDGSGVTWAVMDTGADVNHPDLGPAWVGGVTQGCTAGAGGPGDDAPGGGHGTHVAGAIVGRALGDGSGPAAEIDANGFLYGLGIAPAAKLWSARVVCTGNTLSNADAVKAGFLAGASGSNNSWNNGAARSGYTASAREYDTLVRDANFDTPAVLDQFVVMFSAGNAGTAGLTAPHEAKNIISVGNSGSGRSGTSPSLMIAGSSRGPAVDGRILPVLTGVGGNTASTRSADGGSCGTAIAGTEGLYSLCNGTSMSTPRASGAAALLVQWWRQRTGGLNPSPALVKAIMVNGARDLPGSNPGDLNNIDGSRPIPNNDEGWGIINLKDTLASNVQGFYQDQGAPLTTVGETRTRRVIAANPNAPLRITLAWSDAPGAVAANPALVNNLDLRVTRGADTFLGNVFTAGTSATGGNPDQLANLENVYITNPGAGAVDIEVRATALNGDALSGNGTPGAAKQDYVLVCTNCSTAAELLPPVTTPSVCAGGSIGPFPITVRGAGAAVQMSVNNPPSGLSAATFAPNPVTPSAAGTVSNFTATLDAAVPSGPLTLALRGTSPVFNSDASLNLNVFSGTPLVTSLLTPTSNATGVPLRPNFTWSAVNNAQRYRLEFSRLADFSTLWGQSEQVAASFTPSTNLRPGTQYFWRVRSISPCGTSVFANGVFSTTGSDVLFSDGIGE